MAIPDGTEQLAVKVPQATMDELRLLKVERQAKNERPFLIQDMVTDAIQIYLGPPAEQMSKDNEDVLRLRAEGAEDACEKLEDQLADASVRSVELYDAVYLASRQLRQFGHLDLATGLEKKMSNHYAFVEKTRAYLEGVSDVLGASHGEGEIHIFGEGDASAGDGSGAGGAGPGGRAGGESSPDRTPGSPGQAGDGGGEAAGAESP